MIQKVKELLVNSNYYMGLHIYPNHLKLVYHNDTYDIITIDTSINSSLIINGKAIHCPVYATRLAILYTMIVIANNNKYDARYICIFDEDHLLDTPFDDLVYKIKINGLDTKKELLLTELINDGISTMFIISKEQEAKELDVYDGYVFLTKLLKGELK